MCPRGRQSAAPALPPPTERAALTPILQIIAAGGPRIGYGHIGRCLAIAEELGDAAVFSVEDPGAAGFVRAHGARVAAASDAPVVLIDRRAPTGADEVRALHDAGRRVVLLDDPGAGRDSADLLIDPPTAAAWAPTSAPRLAGFEHALLRREIRDAVRDPAAGRGPVLLTMGGSDPSGATPALAAALAAAGVDVLSVLGPGYRGERPAAGAVLDRPEGFPAALAASRLAVATFGHTLLEAAHLGVPAIAVALHPDQVEDAAAFCANGTAELLDLSDELRPRALVELVRELDASRTRRAELAARGPALVDGCGAERVARAIRALAGVRSSGPSG